MDERDGSALGFADVLLLQVSPDERDVLDVVGPALVGSDGRSAPDGALGFGVTEIAWLSVVVPVATPVVDYLLDVARDVLTDVVKERLTSWLAGLRGRSAASPAPPPPGVPPATAAEAGEVAYRHARALGLAEDRAALLRDAVTGSLVAPPR